MVFLNTVAFKKLMSKTIEFTSDELLVLEQALDFYQHFLCKEPRLENSTTFTGDVSDETKVRLIEGILNKTEAPFDFYMEKDKFMDCKENRFNYLRRTNYEHIESVE